MASASLSLRLGADGRRSLEDIARKRGITPAEVARLAADRAARERVAADMDAIAANWRE